MSVMAVLSVKKLTVNMLLSVLFVSGALACDQDLFITTPKRIEALSGSCLQIPCNFSVKQEERTVNEFNEGKNIIGIWFKSHSHFDSNRLNVIFDSSKRENLYPINIIGNLSQQDCTTLFSNLTASYSEKYFFRIGKRPYLATAICDPVYLTVRDSPQSPTIEIPGELKEKESVTVTCSALTPCPHFPPQLTWNLQQDSQNKMEENSDRTFTTKIQKTITLSDQHDGYIINCSAKYPVNQGKDIKTAEMSITLNVSYAPKNTEVSKNSSGSLVNLTCSSRANPPISHFIWFNNSKDGPTKVSEGQVYSLNATESGIFYCVARNNLGNQTSPPISLNVAGDHLSKPVGAPLIMKILGITMLVSILVTFECWFRFRRSTKPMKEPVEAEYVNTVTKQTP